MKSLTSLTIYLTFDKQQAKLKYLKLSTRSKISDLAESESYFKISIWPDPSTNLGFGRSLVLALIRFKSTVDYYIVL